MKKTIMVSTLAPSWVVGASVQTAYDATKLVSRGLNGTARFVGMGGAMGALGGDISTIGTNPVGIGIYRSSDVMTSFSFSTYGAESKYGGKTFDNNDNRWSYNNIGIVFAPKIDNHTPLRYVNFGLNYHRVKPFYKDMFMEGALNYPQVDYMTGQASGMLVDGVSLKELSDNGLNPYSDNGVGWLGALGWDGLSFDSKNGEYTGVLSQTPYSTFRPREKGEIDRYDFNIAFNTSDKVYLGSTIGAHDVDYTRPCYYSEDYGDKQNYNIGSINRISGSSFDFKMGVTIRLFEDSPFRVGLVVHTPTFYRLTYTTSAYLESNIWMHNNDTGRDELLNSYFDIYKELKNMDQNRKFRLKTPQKHNVNLGYIVGQSLAIGAEYEYEDYSPVKFRYPKGDKMEFEMSEAKTVMKGVNTFCTGAEYKVIPQFVFRLGYNYSLPISKNDAIKYLSYNSANTDIDFVNSESPSNCILGIGYRGSMTYADLAYKFPSYKEDLYPFYNEFDDRDIVTSNIAKITNTRSQVLFTLGIRF